MSDTYNYNSGSPVGGMGGFFGGNCGGFGGCNNWMDLIALIVVGGLFGFGGFGGFGGGVGARGGQLGADAYAATTAAMISQQNTGERVAGISTGVNQILDQTGGIIGQVQRTSDRVQDGFSNLNTYLCQAFNNSAMQGVNNYNGLTGQLTDIRFDAQKCCCETQNMLQSRFCELGYKQQADKNDVLGAVAASEARILAQMNADKTQRLQEELAAAKAQLSQNAQTASIIGAIQANYSPCSPKCGCNGYPYGFNPCAGKCGDLLCSVQNAFADEIAQRIINPTTTATAA